MGIELEQKYLLISDHPLTVRRKLLGLLIAKGCSARLLGDTPQRDVYYDTRGDYFLSSGGSLRLRRKQGKLLLTLKTSVEAAGDGPLARREDELEIGGEGELLLLVKELLPGVSLDGLQPKALVENLRRSYEVTGPAGFLAELDFDKVRYQSWETGRTVLERQVELEQLKGGPEELLRLAGQITRSLPELCPVRISKYQRARELTEGQ